MLKKISILIIALASLNNYATKLERQELQKQIDTYAYLTIPLIATAASLWLTGIGMLLVQSPETESQPLLPFAFIAGSAVPIAVQVAAYFKKSTLEEKLYSLSNERERSICSTLEMVIKKRNRQIRTQTTKSVPQKFKEESLRISLLNKIFLKKMGVIK